MRYEAKPYGMQCQSLNGVKRRVQRVGAGRQLEDAREGLVQKNSQVKGAR